MTRCWRAMRCVRGRNGQRRAESAERAARRDRRVREASETFENTEKSESDKAGPAIPEMEHPRVRDAARWHLAVPAGADDPRPAQPHTIHTRLQQYTCTRYSKKVRHVRAKLRALVAPARRAPRQHRRGHSPAHARARAALRSHKNTCTIQLYLRRWLYVRSPAQRLSPHVERVLHIVHPCTMVDSQPAMSNTSALRRHISPTPNSTRRHSAPDARRHERWGVRAGRQLRLAPLP